MTEDDLWLTNNILQLLLSLIDRMGSCYLILVTMVLLLLVPNGISVIVLVYTNRHQSPIKVLSQLMDG